MSAQRSVSSQVSFGSKGSFTERTCEIQLNGESYQAPDGCSLTALLGFLKRHPRTVAVEHNGEIVPRQEFDTTLLHPGDRIELVQFVQGG